MNWNNPPMRWSELERRLSDAPFARATSPDNPHDDSAPGYKRRRPAYEAQVPTVDRPDGPVVPYAELHCHSNFSFLDGTADPETLVEEAVRLGLDTLALTDHDGLYGAARFAEAAAAYDLRTIYGAELSLGLTTPQNGVADPEGQHLLVLAAGVSGYHRLAGAITEAQLRGDEKGRPRYDLDELAAAAGGEWVVLTGCRKGAVRSALVRGGRAAAADELDGLTARFGHSQVVVELVDGGLPGDSTLNDALAELAVDHGLRCVATGNVHFATPAEYRLGSAMAAVRARRSLAEMDGWLPPPGAHLRSGEEMVRRFARYPGTVAASVALADELAFQLQQAKPNLPRQQVPAGHTPISWLRELARRGADERYGGNHAAAQERLQRELDVIEEKDFPGYFLIVGDAVRFARERGILCQGRGSAANSVVCYVLGITAVDPIKYDLPFERFLSVTRDEEPDIDVDFDSDRREEVIQEVYRRYGRRNAAQVANVISYRPKSAVRDMAKALGYSTGQQDAWSKQIDAFGSMPLDEDHTIPAPVIDLADQLLKAPRHLGIHSGGMVLTDRPVGEVCPIEPGRMADRTVLQWDKDSCAWMGLVKFDFLGLGILSALQHSFDLAAERVGERWTLDTMPKEEAGVFDMLCRADSIGVFQVESRAQVGTLPRLLPRRFYDLVIEVALIRPGPIQGGAVHPYIRRATGKEEVTYLHEKLVPVLERTKGVPLFQEQLMQIAMAVGGCTGDDADLLRRAMGSKRGVEKIERLRDKLYEGMAENGITGAMADEIYSKIQAFANFGFAESHAISFGLLVYASAWIKLHYPGAFLAGLLRAQPMGFYSPQSLVGDARRHGVEVRRPDLVASGVDADLEPLAPGPGGPGRTGGSDRAGPLPGPGPGAGGSLLPDGAGPDGGAPPGRELRRPARPGRGAGAGPRGRRAHRRRAGARALHQPERRGAARRAHRRPDRGAGHGRRVRQLRAVAAAGAVERGLRRQRRDVAGVGRRRGAPHPARDEPGGADPGRPLVDQDLPRRPPGGPPASRAGGAGDRGDHRGGPGPRRPPDPGGRPGHPPAAARYRGRDHVPQPRGRDGDAQHRLRRADVAPVPPRRPERQRHGHPGPGGAQRGGHQPRGRPAGAAQHRGAGRARHPAHPAQLPGLPVTDGTGVGVSVRSPGRASRRARTRPPPRPDAAASRAAVARPAARAPSRPPPRGRAAPRPTSRPSR